MSLTFDIRYATLRFYAALFTLICHARYGAPYDDYAIADTPPRAASAENTSIQTENISLRRSFRCARAFDTFSFRLRFIAFDNIDGLRHLPIIFFDVSSPLRATRA